MGAEAGADTQCQQRRAGRAAETSEMNPWHSFHRGSFGGVVGNAHLVRISTFPPFKPADSRPVILSECFRKMLFYEFVVRNIYMTAHY